MSAEEKVSVLTEALDTIREATYAEFQLQWDRTQGPFSRKVYICPVCGRGSTSEHLKDKWALIHAAAAGGLRTIEEG